MDMGLDDQPELDRRAAKAIIAWNSRGRPDCRYRLRLSRKSEARSLWPMSIG
jgi:hypothetical protein